MKRICGIAAGLAFLVGAAMAQDSAPEQADKAKAELEQMMTRIKVLDVHGGVMGGVVKSAPYSGVEVSESTQVLADGTRIHRENQTTVYRDSEGRVRRESPEGISIFDPVAGASYSLDAKAQIARKMPLGMTVFFSGDGRGGAAGNFSYRVAAPAGTEMKRAEADAKKAEAEMRAQAGTGGDAGWVALNVDPGSGPVAMSQSGAAATMAQTMAVSKIMRRAPAPGESLGSRIIEGVSSDGTRHTETLEAGSIGNDRPIQIVNERWYSPELQVPMMTKHSDPRMGEETFRLTNVSRAEPSPALFQIPAGYQIIERK